MRTSPAFSVRRTPVEPKSHFCPQRACTRNLPEGCPVDGLHGDSPPRDQQRPRSGRLLRRISDR
ncbi:hypothetical protein T261_1995 [Streptomyces lydicus]|nr:hypothetical protein T261_1995 [Streptomyces lydicus]